MQNMFRKMPEDVKNLLIIAGVTLWLAVITGGIYVFIMDSPPKSQLYPD